MEREADPHAMPDAPREDAARKGPAPIQVGGAWRILLDSMTEGVCVATEDGIIVYTNPAEDRLFGYAPGELIGRHVSVQNAFPLAESRRIVAEVLAELERTGSWTGDWRNRRKDGSEFLTSARISRVEVYGRPHRLCVQSDVTEARAAAETLAQSEARLELAAEAAGLGIWDWDLLTNRMAYSDRAKAICGLDPDRAVTIEDVRALVHPDDRPFTRSQARRALDPEIRERAPYEYRIIRPDGIERRVLAHGEAVFAEVDGTMRAVRYAGTIQDVTDRWQLEETERATARRLQLAVDAGRMAVWEIDLKADTIAPSPALNRILGFPEDALPTLNELRSGYFPGERERLQAILQETLARGERYIEAEFRYRWPDGSPKWLMLRCEILIDEAGEPDRAVGVLADITERKRTEEELRLSEARLSLAQRAAGAGVWDWDLVERQLIWSPEVFRILRMDPATPPERLDTMWNERIHPDDLERVMTQVTAAQAQGQSFSLDFRIVTEESEVRWVRSQCVAVNDHDGRPVRLTGIVVDVTMEHSERERLRAEARLLETEVAERTRERDRIFELSSDIFAVAGMDGYLRSVNPAFVRLLGYPQQQLLATPFPALIHPEDQAASAEIVAALRRGESVSRFENRLVRPDGRVLSISWTAEPEGDRFYAVGRDVTVEREREQQLRQAQKLEAIGQLTGGVAHDINNLLMVFSAGLEILERQENAERRRAVAEGMRQAVTRGTSLTRQLLAFARRQALRPEPIDIRERIGAMGELLARSLGDHIELRSEFAEGLWPVFADPGELELSIVNLCVNARDAMPEGGAITISASNLPGIPGAADGDFVRLTISDTGAGMPPEVLARVFEPFYTTKEIGKGTGLGLPQVYGFAKQSGGHVELRSQPGQGTEVVLLLPRSSAAPAHAPSAEPAPTAPRRGTVLLVEDDREVATLVREMLEQLHYEVVQAAGAAAALGALADGRPVDLMLSDIMMPGGMNGVELAQEAQRRRPGLRILLTSGYPGHRRLRPGAVAARVLPKPFTLAQLSAALDSIAVASLPGAGREEGDREPRPADPSRADQ